MIDMAIIVISGGKVTIILDNYQTFSKKKDVRAQNNAHTSLYIDSQMSREMITRCRLPP